MTHNNSSTSSSKRKKYLSRFASLLGMLVLFFGVYKLLDHMYVSEEGMARAFWHEYKAFEENIDIAVVGSSHVYCGVDPRVLDERSGKTSYTVSTSGMVMESAYYMIKQLEADNELEHVVLDMFYALTAEEGFIAEDSFKNISVWRVSDYYEPYFDRLGLIWSATSSDSRLESLFPVLRFREMLFNKESIVSLTEEKNSDKYKNYQIGPHSVNLVKGYLPVYLDISEASLITQQKQFFSEERVLDTSAEEYLCKIIEFCQQRNIPITLISVPPCALELSSILDYDKFHQAVQLLAESYGVNFYDFNLCRAEYFDSYNVAYFHDLGHINTKGSAIFTSLLWDVISGSPEENEKYFASSIKEKLEEEEPRVFGLTIHDGTDEDYFMDIASNREIGLEYQISCQPDGGEEYVLQEFSESRRFTLSGSEHGTMTISYRPVDEPDAVQEYIMKY